MLTQRVAGKADLDAMWALRTRAFRITSASHYPPEIIARLAAAPAPPRLAQLTQAGGAVIAEENGHMLGFAILNVAAGEVDAVFVDPDAGGRGIGSALLRTLEEMALASGCDTLHLSASLNAVGFYEAAGFVRIRDEAYPHSSGFSLDSVFMQKRLR